METFKDRLLKIISELKHSPSSFAVAAGLNPGVVNTYIGKRGSTPSRPNINKILAAFPQINPDFLESGTGTPLRPTGLRIPGLADMLGAPTPTERAPHGAGALDLPDPAPWARADTADRVTFVPEYITAGLPAGFADREFMMTLPQFFMPGLGLGPGTHFCFPVRGTSMIGTIDPGDLFVGQLVEDRFAIRPGEVYALWLDDGNVVKRVQLGNNGDLVLHSDNPQYGPYTVKRTDVRVMLRFEMKLSFSSANGNLFTGQIERLMGQLETMSDRLTAGDQQRAGAPA